MGRKVTRFSSVLLLAVFLASIASPIAFASSFSSQASNASNNNSTISVSFSVSPTGYVTVYLSGLPSTDNLTIHYGTENYPQGPWIHVYNSQMLWDGHNFTVTIGPFSNNTWVAWVFFDKTKDTWINYDNHAFWNWNLQVNPSDVGKTYAKVLQNGSILITAIGRAPDEFYLHYGLTSGPQTGLPWYNVTDLEMKYNPLYGNYTALIGPFKEGQWVQWVYHDKTLDKWYNNYGKNFAIQDLYSPIYYLSSSYNKYVYLCGEGVSVNITLKNTLRKNVSSTLLISIGNVNETFKEVLRPGINNIEANLSTRGLKQGIYHPTLMIYSNNRLWKRATLEPLYILNVTGKKPIAFVLVWHMHQPLYLSLNGTWEQPWVWLHTGQDFYWNGTLVGAYELQAMLINKFNVSVTIDFTPVLLYQWEYILSQKKPEFSSPYDFGINISHDVIAVNKTLFLYKKLIKEGKVEVLTVPFYHPLQPLILQDGYWGDLLSQLLMGKEYTEKVFGVVPKGTWTPEEAFSMGLVSIYNESNISFTILDQDAFLKYSTLVKGSLNPDKPFIVENNLGQTIYVLFRNTTLSNEFGFKFFSQSPSLTAKELIQQLAQVYMKDPGGIVVVALDGENPLIFNPRTGPKDLYAIYKALSQYQGKWLVMETASRAIKTHSKSVITNLPVSSWNLNLNYWNNGNAGKKEIWNNLSLAREYLLAYTYLLGATPSPVVRLPINEVPNSTNMLDTMWNYIYVAEGSDWSWQTGPPANGPKWFKQQGISYANATMKIVKEKFNKITLTGAGLFFNVVWINIYNGLGKVAYINLALKVNGTTIVKKVAMTPGPNIYLFKLPKVRHNKSFEVLLYSPVSRQEAGAVPIPISSYGFLIKGYSITSSPIPFVKKGMQAVKENSGIIGLLREILYYIGVSFARNIMIMSLAIGAAVATAFLSIYFLLAKL